jgi:hypothetical protein
MTFASKDGIPEAKAVPALVAMAAPRKKKLSVGVRTRIASCPDLSRKSSVDV